MSVKGPLRSLLVACCFLAGLSPLTARDDRRSGDGQIRIHLGTTPNFEDAKASKLTSLELRPSQGSIVYLFVENTQSGFLEPALTVTTGASRIDSSKPAKGTHPKTEIKEVAVKLGSWQWLPRVGENAHITVPLKLDKELFFGAENSAGTTLQFVVEDRGDRLGQNDTAKLTLQPMRVDDYLRFRAPPSLTDQRLTISVERKEDKKFFTTPCRLSLDYDFGGAPPGENSILVNQIDQDQDRALLALTKVPATVGTVSVYADGILAKTYQVSNNGVVSEDKSPNVLRVVRRASPKAATKDPNAPKTVDVQFAVSNPSEKAHLRVSVDRTGTGQDFEPRRDFPTSRQLNYSLSTKEGGLAVRLDVSDWTYSVNTEGLGGKIVIKGELLDSDNRPIKDAAATLAMYVNSPPPSITIDVEASPTAEAGRDYFQPGEKVTLKATAGSKVGIHKVSFFTGDVPPPQFRREWVVTTKNPNDLHPVITLANVLLPETKGPLTVGVVVEDVNGETSSATKTIRIAEPPSSAPGSAGKSANLKGKVVQGVEEIPQHGLTVELIKGMAVVKTAKTDEKGAFEMKDVPPGAYVVRCVRAIDKTKAVAAVTLEPGENKMEKSLSLSR